MAALVLFALIPYGGEIALALGGITFAIIIYRQADKPGT